MTSRKKFWKIFWKFCFYLSLLSGLAGMTAFLLDILWLKQEVFVTMEVIKFSALLVIAIFIRTVIYPYFHTPNFKEDQKSHNQNI